MDNAEALLLFLTFIPQGAPVDRIGCPGCGGPVFEVPASGQVSPPRCEDPRCPNEGTVYVGCPIRDCIAPPCCRSSFGPRGWRLIFPHCTDGHGYRWHMPRRWAVALGPDGEARIIGDRMISAEAATPWEMVQRLWIFAASKGTVTQ